MSDTKQDFVSEHGWSAHELTGTPEQRNAAPKARADIDEILLSRGLRSATIPASPFDRVHGSVLDKTRAHFTSHRQWVRGCENLGAGDVLVVQFPPRNHTLFFPNLVGALKRRGVNVVLLVHDLDCLRYRGTNKVPLYSRVRNSLEEVSLLKTADMVICHNDRMAEVLCGEMGVREDRLVPLAIFDYLVPGAESLEADVDQSLPIAIAGNLNRLKSGYIYELPDDVRFNLYGLNVEADELPASCSYLGSMEPEELAQRITGSYGLVWDGPSAATCADYYGKYLRVNNPHKMSLYLAAGMPVVVWEEAAVVPFVRERGVGITVGSLFELNDALESVSQSSYEEMRANARALASQLRAGAFTLDAIERSFAGLR